MEAKKVQKSYFDVLGICCPSEVPLIDNILKPLAGVIEVSVIVPSRTVIVIHDDQIISQLEILKALNSARLEANIRVYGEESQGKKWPAPYTIGCGILAAVATFKFLFPPLRWVGLAAAMIGSPPVLLRSMASVRNMTMDVNILVFIAVAGAIALGDYWEAGTTVFLFTIAEWLESRASHKANAVMSSLMSMTPQKAVLAQTGQIIDVKDIIIDTILAVKAGEVIPMDGVVVEGSCEVDEKTLTGESLPVPKQIQSVVWAGTINLNGYISVRTTSLTDDCVVAKMAKLVEEAQNSKSRTQRLVDQFAKYYTPAVMIVSVCLVVVPAALRKHDLKHWAHLALVVLVSACPCALILSTPVATFCAFTKAATAGILVKGGDYLETLGKIKTMAFDKTGTITRGEFSVTSFRASSSGFSLNTLLFWVSSIESKASHPMAAALVAYAQSRSIEPKPESVKEFQNFPGEGIYGEIEGRNIYVGNKKIARRAGCQTVPPHGDDNEGGTVGYIFSGENLLGVFSMADTCRSGVLDAIKELKSLGIKTAMLTGDSKIAASRVQDQLQNALDEFHAELLPEDKVRIIEKLKMRGPTAMIGDGVNDAPALATADIGISMGIAGSALATETGHITLMSNDIRKVPQAIRLARKTLWKIRQNVVLAVVTKSAILVLAFCGHPLLWAAVLADVGTCLLVIFNSMLLLQGTSKPKGKRHVGHGSHSHSPHQKHACGSDHVHHQHNHSNLVKEHHCSHEEVQACSHTAKPDLCVETSVKCTGHKCCATILHESPSHLIEITNSDNIEDTGEEDLCDDHIVCIEKCSTAESSQASCCQNSHDSSLKSSRSTSACQGHSSSVSSDVNHLGKEVDSKQVGEAHSDDHSHHHNHHHDHHPVLALSDEKKTISTVHNEGRNVDCHACHEPKNGTMKMCSKEVKTVHLGKSLERREIGGCCRSYRKECGGMHGCQPLTEIISE